MKSVAVRCFLVLFICGALAPAVSQADAPARTRITKISAFDGGNYAAGAGDPRVDLTQLVCESEDTNSDGVPDTETLESFTDTVIGIEVLNDEGTTIQINKISFVIKNGDAGGRTVKSKTFSPLERGEIAAGSRGTIFGFFLKAAGSVKLLPARGGDAALGTGFKTVTAILNGRTGTGRKITLKAKVTLSFSDYDRCEA